MVELSSETSHSAPNGSINGRTMLYRSEIDNHGAEISPLCHFSADNRCVYRRACPYPCFLAEVVPFGEIFANPSDLKHVMELLGCSDGLSMVITTRMHRWDAFEGLS